jgi:hypothetical protein
LEGTQVFPVRKAALKSSAAGGSKKMWRVLAYEALTQPPGPRWGWRVEFQNAIFKGPHSEALLFLVARTPAGMGALARSQQHEALPAERAR